MSSVSVSEWANGEELGGGAQFLPSLPGTRDKFCPRFSLIHSLTFLFFFIFLISSFWNLLGFLDS